MRRVDVLRHMIARGADVKLVQFVRDPPCGVARRLQFADTGQDALLPRGVRYQVQAVRRRAIAEGDSADALAIRPPRGTAAPWGTQCAGRS